ncbi:MAG: hypothetical protein JWN13_578, partial [Betaproteobacteria bacterium]|nr:hypothetical protein [Betaproteobacteria bacterium]
RNIYIEKCAPIADFVFGAPLRMTRPHRSASTTALVKEALVAMGTFSSARIRPPDIDSGPEDREAVRNLLKKLELLP